MPHGEEGQQADLWTKINTLTIIIAVISGTGYFTVLFHDFFGDSRAPEEKLLPVPWWQLAISILIALLSAAGETYCHYKLNTNLQDAPDPERGNIINHNPIDAPNRSLTFFEKAAVAGDYLSHVGEYAGPVVMFMGSVIKARLPMWGNVIKHGSAIVLGGALAYADTRACKNNLLKSDPPTFSTCCKKR